MKDIDVALVDALMLTLIRESYKGTPLRATYEIYATELNKRLVMKDMEITRHQARHSMERLANEGLISHKWNGKYLETVPLDKVAIHPKTHKARIVPIKATPTVYRMYDLFKDFYHDGHYITMENLAQILNVSKREVREMKMRFNRRGYNLKNDRTFTRKILGNNKGYTLVSTEQDKREARHIIVDKLLDAVEELRIFDEDMGINDQLRFDMNTFEVRITKSLSNDLVKEETK